MRRLPPVTSFRTALPAPKGISLFVLLLAGLTALVYANSFLAPFVFDDLPGIVDNPSIRDLRSLGDVFFPSTTGGVTVSGRPVVNLSLALNYAVSGLSPWSYHLANLAIHIAAGLFLFGIVRRVLEVAPTLPGRLREPALPLAAVTAGLWLLHPLQTESVTYVIQRAESLCGFFYLATLYLFLWGATSATPRHAWIGAWCCCVLGLGTKEVMASAPIVIFLFDRTFLAGSFREAWFRRGRMHLAFASTWLLLAFLVASTGNRGGTAGLGTAMSSWSYLWIQCGAIVRYLRLMVWPDALVFDYGLGMAGQFGRVWPQALFLVVAFVGTLIALRRRPVLGFLGACFFLLLAPSSSVVPVITQTAAEHRMYLALAPLLVGATLLVHVLLPSRGLFTLALLAVGFGFVTAERNRDYRSALSLWGDTAAKWPDNARAHNNLGQAYFIAGRIDDSVASYRRALSLQPRYPETHYNLGVSLAQLGRLPEAIQHYQTALEIQPLYPEVHNNLANALVKLGRWQEAVDHYEIALAQKPDFPEAQNNYGNALLQSARAAEAPAHFQRALALKPDYPEAHYNLGNALAGTGHMAEALAEYRAALRLSPKYSEARINAGNALLQLDRPTEAIDEYRQAIAEAPDSVDARYNLGSALLELKRWPEAIETFSAVLRLRPDLANAHRGLGLALVKVGRPAEAVPHYEFYARAFPDDPSIREELAQLRR